MFQITLRYFRVLVGGEKFKEDEEGGVRVAFFLFFTKETIFGGPFVKAGNPGTTCDL